MGLMKKRSLLLVASLGALVLAAALIAATASAAGKPGVASKAAAGARSVAGQRATATAPSGSCTISEGFDDITALPDWAIINHSEPLGVTDWFQGNDTVFPAHTGDPTSYIGANFNNTSDGTISNWLLIPVVTIVNGNSVTFWTRTVTGSNFPDRLQVRASTAGDSTDVGTSSTDVGDFTHLLLDINPTYTLHNYPED